MVENIRQTKITLLEFWTEWCLYSRLLKPKVEHVAERYQGHVEVKRLNAGEYKELTTEYEVLYVPALLILDRGRLEEKWYGDVPIRLITDALDRYV